MMEATENKEKKIQKYKLEAVEELKVMFETAKDYIFTNYRGLSVEQISDLRRKLREQNAEYKVVKNRFAKIAFKQMERPELGDNLIGPTAIALSREEAGPVAKTLVQFCTDAPVEIKGGLIEGEVYDSFQVEAFSKLPTKMELLAMLLGTMQAPLRNLVYTLNAIPEKLVRTLQAVADKKQSEG
jgi:large subunit ribosomal protein L10